MTPEFVKKFICKYEKAIFHIYNKPNFLNQNSDANVVFGN